MGRTNGKLIPFLKEGLHMKKYINLTYELEGVFCIELPRYEQNIDPAFEAILKDWYAVNGRLDKYENYSSAKSVFQAALKKSLYLISLPKNVKKLRFRLSEPQEIQEKRKAQKEKNIVHEANPPSVTSSGYHSGSDDNMDLLENLPEFLDEGFQVNDSVLSPTQENDNLANIDNSTDIQLNYVSEYKQNMETSLLNFETMSEIGNVGNVEEKCKAEKMNNAVPQANPPLVSSLSFHSDIVNMDFLENWSDFLDEGLQVNDVVAYGQVNVNLTDIGDSTENQLDSVNECRQSMESGSNDEGMPEIGNIDAMQGLPGFESFENLLNYSNNELSQILGNLDVPTAEDSQNLSVTENLPAIQEIELQQHTTPGNVSQNVWICKRKIQIGSGLWQLVCELAVPELGVDEKAPETIIVDGMLEAGRTYDLKKKVRVDSYLILILTCLG